MIMIGLIAAVVVCLLLGLVAIVIHRNNNYSSDTFEVSVSLSVVCGVLAVTLFLLGCSDIVGVSRDYGRIESYLAGGEIVLESSQNGDRVLVNDVWCINMINEYRARRTWWATRAFTPPVPDSLANYGLVNTGGK